MFKHESMDYFKVLELSPNEICGKDDAAIADLVKKSHARLYREALDSRYATRSDGLSREDWMDILNEARDTLENPQKRQAYLISLGLVGAKSGLVGSKLGRIPEAPRLRAPSPKMPMKSKLGSIWDLADSVDNEYTGKVLRATTSGVEVEIHIHPDETYRVPISQMNDGSAGAVVQIGDEVTVRTSTTDNPGRIDFILIAVRGVPVAAHPRQRIPREVTVTKPDVQPSKDNRGVGGKQPRQPVSEEAENGNNAPVAQNSDCKDANFDKVNKGDARLPRWVRVLGCLWCVIIPGSIVLLKIDADVKNGLSDSATLFAVLSLACAIPSFCIWVLVTLSIKGVPFRTKVGVVFKVIVAMLAALSFFALSGLLLFELGLIGQR